MTPRVRWAAVLDAAFVWAVWVVLASLAVASMFARY